jgi:putative polyhydroxyalkanoate system protein
VSRLSLRRAHDLDAGAARARVERAAARLTERFGARCHWDGEVLNIAHASVAGTVTLEPGAVVVEAELKFPLALFRGRAEAEITALLERELAQ